MTEQEKQQQLDLTADLVQKITNDYTIPLLTKLLDSRIDPIKHQLNKIQDTGIVTQEIITSILTELENQHRPPGKI